jgi:membrane-associated phospholipid phosphatase
MSDQGSAVHRLAASIDNAVEAKAAHLRGNPAADRVFYAASAAAEFSMLWHGVGIARVLIARKHWKEAAALSAVLGVESLVVNQGIKRLFKRARPVFEGERPHHFRTPITSSFPSGHTTAACCAATWLTWRSPRLAPLWWTLAGTVAYSRIHAKIHHGSDVAAGIPIGTAIGLAGIAATKQFLDN